MYRERFLMVRQRVHRHDLFRPPIIESSRREYIKLSPLDSLVSCMDMDMDVDVHNQSVSAGRWRFRWFGGIAKVWGVYF